jgi:hypothetical protein
VLIKACTALIHKIRGPLQEHGVILPPGMTTCHRLIVPTLEAHMARLTPCICELFWHLGEAVLALDKRLASDNEKLTAFGRAPPECQRLQIIAERRRITAS